MNNVYTLRFPVGEFHYAESYTAEETRSHIDDIAALPAELNDIVGNLNDEELERTYRTNSWTIRQVIHHIADSHVNAYIRVKSALTEDVPIIRPYDQDGWAALPDSNVPVAYSLAIIEGIHTRLAVLLASLDERQLALRFYHPENKRLITLAQTCAAYSWHGKHHLGHITLALNKVTTEG